MFRIRHSMLLIILPVVLCLWGYSAANCEMDKPAKKCFIDLDGDGFDDNAADNNGDGIPDFSDKTEESHITRSEQKETTSSQIVDFDINTPDFTMTYSDIYFLNCVPTRGMTKTRGGFGMADEFGPGNGIGLGALSSGGCSGGVCRP